MSSTRSRNKVDHQRRFFETVNAKDGQHGDIYVNLPINLPPLSVSWISKIANSPAKDRGYTRTYYSYPAKFQAHLPKGLISHSTRLGIWCVTHIAVEEPQDWNQCFSTATLSVTT